MKHLSGYDNIWETEAWYFWGSNMKVLLGHLDWGQKRFWVSVLSAIFLSGKTFC